MSDCLPLHGLQHARLPCASLSPGACSNSYPSSWWCHPTMSSSVIPFSSCLQSFPATASFSISQFLSGGQNIGDSASASVLPMNIQDWFLLRLTSLISSIQGTLRCLLHHHSSKASILWCSAFFMVHSHIHTWLYGYFILFQSGRKNIALIRQTFVSNVFVFDMLCRLVIAFLPRSKCLLISWLKSPSAMILEPKKIKSVTVSIVSPSICHEVIGPDDMIFVFLNVEF